MVNQPLNENDTQKILANPYYAIVIDKELCKNHPTLLAEEDWVKANARLINEMGPENWLHRLLDVLKGNYL